MSRLRVPSGVVFVLIAASSLHAGVLLNEGFDNISTLTGWTMVNDSSPVGVLGWFQGNPGTFTAQAGSNNAYIAANFNSAGADGNISNWLMMPVVSLQSSLELTFYTRTVAGSPLPDRLEVWLSTNGTSSSVTDFSSELLAINPTLSVGGYPEGWTQYTVTFAGGLAGSGRFAFHYDVTDTAHNANYIGIDSVTIDSVTPTDVPEPFMLGPIACAFGVSVLRRRLI